MFARGAPEAFGNCKINTHSQGSSSFNPPLPSPGPGLGKMALRGMGLDPQRSGSCSQASPGLRASGCESGGMAGEKNLKIWIQMHPIPTPEEVKEQSMSWWLWGTALTSLFRVPVGQGWKATQPQGSMLLTK